MSNINNPRYAKSHALFERAGKTVPLASQTFSKSHISYPRGRAPLFLESGSGCRVIDVDCNEYIDFVSGLLPVILGYGDSDVDGAVIEQISRGVTLSLATKLEMELAELLVEIVPCAEMVRFGKNGSDHPQELSLSVHQSTSRRSRIHSRIGLNKILDLVKAKITSI